MRDDEFLRAFFDTTLPPSQFHHRDHLRLTWLLVRRHGFPTACDMIRGGIQRYATAHGVGAKYHETMTTFWVRLIAHVIDASPDVHDFDLLLAAFPRLLDKSLPSLHWRADTLDSETARVTWVEADLRPMP